MPPSPPSLNISRPKAARAANVAALAAAGIAFVALIGWAAHRVVLTSVAAGLTSMRPNAAICLLLLGIAIPLLNRAEPRVRSVGITLDTIAVAISALSAWQHVTGSDLGIDSLFARAVLGTATGDPQLRMALSTALALAALGLAGSAGRSAHLQRVGAMLATAVALVAAFVVIGYAYRIPSLFDGTAGVVMALNTAVALLLLAFATLVTIDAPWMQVVLDRKSVSARLTRRSIGAAAMLVSSVGLIRILGERAGVISGPTGTAIMTIVSLLLFTAFLLRFAVLLRRHELMQTEREAALARSEERFRLTVEATDDIAYDWDVATGDLWWSAAAGRLFGVTPEPRIEWWSERLHPAERETVLGDLDAFLASRHDRWALEYHLRVDDDRRYASILERGYALRGDDGSAVRMIGVLMDITVIRQAEAMLRDANVELERRVAQRTAELLDVNARLATEVERRRTTEDQLREERDELASLTAQLRASNEDLEAFGYSVSHDLRAPLRSIQGFSQAVLDDHGDSLDAEARRNLERVTRASERMSHLIDDLLSLSRLSRTGMEMTDVDLGALAADAVQRLREEEPERTVEVIIEPGLVVRGDRTLLGVAVDNLIANAWKFTSKREDARIEVGFDRGEQAWFVRDNGVGFDMAYAGKLFAPFQRLHHAREFAGTGIGLATIQRILRRHGGRIWVTAAPGQGATFRFTLEQKGSDGAESPGGHGANVTTAASTSE